MHFQSVPVMKLVEVIPGAETSEETVALAMEACRIIGKTAIRAKDTRAARNRILVPYLNDAATAFQEAWLQPRDRRSLKPAPICYWPEVM